MAPKVYAKYIDGDRMNLYRDAQKCQPYISFIYIRV